MAPIVQILFALVAISHSVFSKPDKVVCYYQSSAGFRSEAEGGEFHLKDIDTSLCTHIIYESTFLYNGIIYLTNSGNSHDLREMKAKDRNLQILVTSDWMSEKNGVFDNLIATDTLRQQFAEDVLKFLKLYEFDGFDFRWDVNHQEHNIYNILLLIGAMRDTFDKSGSKYLITSRVAATGKSADSFDVEELTKHLDFINLMAYNFNETSKETMHNAPLLPPLLPWNKETNVEEVVNSWIERGTPPNKIVLGVSIFGQKYKIFGSLKKNTTNFGLHVPANPQKRLGYNEICKLKNVSHWNDLWDDNQKVPVMFKEYDWVSYDNERSIKLKAEFAVSMNLGGVIIRSIDTEDFQGCCGKKFALLLTINKVILPSGKPEPFRPDMAQLSGIYFFVSLSIIILVVVFHYLYKRYRNVSLTETIIH